MAYAHSRNQAGSRHDLLEHLSSVADLSGRFASKLDAAELGRLLGTWHDVGKFNPAFQAYLQDCEADPQTRRRGPDHKAAGVRLAFESALSLLGLLLHGHHGGLTTPSALKSWYEVAGTDPGVEASISQARNVVSRIEPEMAVLPEFAEHDPLSAELFLRLLFSTLVDADFLDTEGHFSPELTGRRGSEATLEELRLRLDANQVRLPAKNHSVSRARWEIFADCVRAASKPPGLFRLTAPTGAGKTRSVMAFALAHAVKHEQDRVIIVSPFISITEQTTDVYQEIFETEPSVAPVVLEHHSGVVADDESDRFSAGHQWARLAAENWDAPVVVTTAVQLFESLFARSTSRCRKLHRLVNSVIVLDEAQALPAHLLTPILDVIKDLTRYYNTTVVFSTATQPAFDALDELSSVAMTEIVDDPDKHFRSLQRVQYTWLTDRTIGWAEIAEMVRRENQALVVLNTKNDAVNLIDALDDPRSLHLSTLLCGAHRREVLAEVSRRLNEEEACLLVSTQVIEAGVDIDFPTVFRAVGPLDGIIQSAGRCNREGHLPVGRVIVFDPRDGGLPPGFYRMATDITRTMIAEGKVDMASDAVVRDYFGRVISTWGLDREGIQGLRRSLDFPEVARRFRMIEDDTESVVVPFGSTDEQRLVSERLDSLRVRRGNPRSLLRRLRPFMVNVRTREAERFRHSGLISEILPGLGEWMGGYDQLVGLTIKDLRPDELVV